jgi:hypothetical protein
MINDIKSNVFPKFNATKYRTPLLPQIQCNEIQNTSSSTNAISTTFQGDKDGEGRVPEVLRKECGVDGLLLFIIMRNSAARNIQPA